MTIPQHAPVGRNQPRRRGTCPGVLAPMAVGDGLLLRVRVPAGVLPAEHAGRIAALADRFGNGLIDLSHRGNLQLRGMSADGLKAATDALRALGYVADDAASEAVRNVLCSPTAGLDPAAAMDVRRVARTLDARLAADSALYALPPKFGWLVCGGGLGHLAGSSTDVRFDALDGVRLQVSLGGTLERAAVLGACRADDVAEVASALGRAFLELRAAPLHAALAEPPRRMAGLVAALGVEPFAERLSTRVSPLSPGERIKVRGTHLMDVFGAAAASFLTAAFPFGRLTGAALSALAATTRELRITPWRALLLVAPADAAAETASAQGAILSHGDRRLKLTACSGVTGCDVGTTDTHATALAIAGRAGPLLDPVRMVHVSGCAKGCAHPAEADVTLTAREGRYDIARHAKPGDAPLRAGLSPDDAVACVAELLTADLLS